MSTTFDRNYGKSIVYESNPTPSIPLLQPSKVVFAFDTARFYAFYADLLTRPVRRSRLLRRNAVYIPT